MDLRKLLNLEDKIASLEDKLSTQTLLKNGGTQQHLALTPTNLKFTQLKALEDKLTSYVQERFEHETAQWQL
jgi:hypothetical protein